MRKSKCILSTLLALTLCLSLCVPAYASGMSKAGERNVMAAQVDLIAVVDENGSLWMLGDSTGSGIGGSTTVPAKLMDGVASISCGLDYNVVIKTDGSLWTWGGNYYGKLGNGTTEVALEPVKVLDDVVSAACGHYHTAAVKTDGSLWIWGSNSFGELGNGGQGNAAEEGSGRAIQTVPVKVMDDVAAVSCGDGFTAAVKTDGSLWMWGSNSFGQLGNSTKEGSQVPVKVLDGVAAVSCGRSYTAALKTDGSLWMWGSNNSGALGNGTTLVTEGLVKALDGVASVSCGEYHVGAVKTDGSLWMWGENSYGKLGNGSVERVLTPAKLMDGVVTVLCGDEHTAAVKTDGSLWTWGSNIYDQLGNGGTGNKTDEYGRPYQTVPVQIPLGDGVSAAFPTSPAASGAPEQPAGPEQPATPTAPAPMPEVVLSAQKLAVDGTNVDCEKYNIGGSNYFKLRDLAQLLNGTGSQFGVGFDAAASTVSITTGAAYEPNGTELVVGADNSATAQPSSQSILIDGAAHSELTVYNIGGSNFFQLRELGNVLGFGVDYDGDTNTAIVRSVQK